MKRGSALRDLFDLSDLLNLYDLPYLICLICLICGSPLAPPLDLPDLLLPRQEEVLVRFPPRAEVGSVGSGLRAGQRNAGLSRRRARLQRGVRRGVPGETFVFVGIPLPNFVVGVGGL